MGQKGQNPGLIKERNLGVGGILPTPSPKQQGGELVTIPFQGMVRTIDIEIAARKQQQRSFSYLVRAPRRSVIGSEGSSLGSRTESSCLGSCESGGVQCHFWHGRRASDEGVEGGTNSTKSHFPIAQSALQYPGNR